METKEAIALARFRDAQLVVAKALLDAQVEGLDVEEADGETVLSPVERFDALVARLRDGAKLYEGHEMPDDWRVTATRLVGQVEPSSPDEEPSPLPDLGLHFILREDPRGRAADMLMAEWMHAPASEPASAVLSETYAVLECGEVFAMESVERGEFTLGDPPGSTWGRQRGEDPRPAEARLALLAQSLDAYLAVPARDV